MANKGLSPEEQLLNLIEKEDGSKAKKPKKKLSFTSSKLGKLFTPFSRMGPALKKLKGRMRGESPLEFINKAFIVLCSVVICYSVVDFIFNKKDIEKFYNTVPNIRRAGDEAGKIVALRPFLHYLVVAQRRNIFNPIEIVKEADVIQEKKLTLQNLLADLVLVGIAWGEEPQAMIESKETKQTYFLNKGETINSLKIERILRDKVILSHEGQEAELI